MHSVAPAEWNSLNQFSCLLGQRCSQHFSHLTQVNPWHVLTLQRCHFGSHVGKWPSVSRQTPLHGSDAAGPLFLFCSACCWVSLLGLPCFCTVVWLCLHRHSATGAFKLASWRGSLCALTFRETSHASTTARSTKWKEVLKEGSWTWSCFCTAEAKSREDRHHPCACYTLL